MIATIAVIAAITEKKKSSVIAAIKAIIMETTFQQCDNDRWDRTFSMRSLRLLESGFLMIAAIVNSDRSDHMETRLKWRVFTE